MKRERWNALFNTIICEYFSIKNFPLLRHCYKAKYWNLRFVLPNWKFFLQNFIDFVRFIGRPLEQPHSKEA